METQGFSTQCKVRQCSQCQGGTEYYCNTCKYNLCLQCKERHAIDLDTIYHDVVIYREKNKYTLKQETCVTHPDRKYNKYCHSCKIPFCVQCTGHKKHQILGITTAYKRNRHKQKGTIQNIRTDVLFTSFFLLTQIKSDKKCQKEIHKHQSEMSIKAQKLKNIINTVICDVTKEIKSFMLCSLHQQKRKMNRNLASIENFVHRFEHLANTPVKLVLFLKKAWVPKLDTPNHAQYIRVSLTEEINVESVIKLLTEIQILETGKRQVRNECLLKLISPPVFNRSVTMTGVNGVRHISRVAPDKVWVSDTDNLILTNTVGVLLHHISDIASYFGAHTVSITSDLIYIGRDHNIYRLSKNNKRKSTLIKKIERWEPHCVYCSPFNGDLLVGMCHADTYATKINRYNNKECQIQTIQHNSAGQRLYEYPMYITENRNKDVIVSDYIDIGLGAVVVTERGGRHRFSYKGPPSGLHPYAVCTDALSHILVCDWHTHTVVMIDERGQFLSLLKTQQQRIDIPQGLSYDEKTHLLWVGSYNDNRMCVYRYIQRQDYLAVKCVDLREMRDGGARCPIENKDG